MKEVDEFISELANQYDVSELHKESKEIGDPVVYAEYRDFFLPKT